EPVYRRTNFPGDHPLWRGGLFPSPAAVRKALDEADALLIVGANVFTWFLHTEGTPFPRGLSVVQVDDDPWEIGRSYPVSLGIVARLEDGHARLGHGGGDRRPARPAGTEGRRDDRRRLRHVRSPGALNRRPVPAADHLRRAERRLVRKLEVGDAEPRRRLGE